MKKSYSYDSAMSSLPTYPAATQKLLPTTFISNKPYSSSTAQEKAQTIDEESETNVDDDEVKLMSDENAQQQQQPEAQQQLTVQQSYMPPEISHAFQVTSPTEDTIPTSTFDYLYEFSETRKVLEEFFKVPDTDKIKELEKFSDFNESDDSLVSFPFCDEKVLFSRLMSECVAFPRANYDFLFFSLSLSFVRQKLICIHSGHPIRLPRPARKGDGGFPQQQQAHIGPVNDTSSSSSRTSSIKQHQPDE